MTQYSCTMSDILFSLLYFLLASFAFKFIRNKQVFIAGCLKKHLALLGLNGSIVRKKQNILNFRHFFCLIIIIIVIKPLPVAALLSGVVVFKPPY